MANMISSILVIIATIVLFLFAVNKFSKSIERVAGDKMKYYLSKATSGPIRATFLGGIVNAIIQSNTALTVTLVGLVNAGLVTLRGSLGVVIGSNVGNTLTSQLLAFNVMAFAPVFIVIGFMMRRFENPVKHYSSSVFYFGLMFLSLSYLQLLFAPYFDSPMLLKFISGIDSVSLAILIGVIGASILQSSTATSAIAITLASTGLLNFDQAFGIVVGSGVGTTVTALLASLVMNTAAQRTAFAHLWFNITTVILTLVFYTPIKSFIYFVDAGTSQLIANAHLFVSILTAIVLLLIFNVYLKFVTLIIPEKGFFHKIRGAIDKKHEAPLVRLR